jgi:hypothetical protein
MRKAGALTITNDIMATHDGQGDLSTIVGGTKTRSRM